MRTDRELLELAAKAAGMGYLMWTPGAAPIVPAEHRAIADRICWHPLSDDGDALRLAVKLHFDLHFYWNGCDDQYDTVMVHTHGAKADAEEQIGFYLNGGQMDELAATRRAIVRAAAEIGKAMP